MNDLYLPGGSGHGLRFEGGPALVLYGPSLGGALVMLSVIVDHYDERDSTTCRRIQSFSFGKCLTRMWPSSRRYPPRPTSWPPRAPAPESRQARSVSEPGTTRSMNYVEREARNQALGEAFVMNDEQARMIYAGKENPGEQLEQISATVGPAARSAATTNVTYT